MPLLYLVCILTANVYHVLSKNTLNYDIPLNDIERQQNEILKNLTKEREATKKLQHEINEIDNKPTDPSRIGISVKNHSVKPEKLKESDQGPVSSRHNYTPPVIILLPEDTSDRDLWEYNASKLCLKGGYHAAYKGDSFTLVEMAEDSTATIDELHEHVQKVEKSIEEYVQKGKDLRTELQQLKLTNQNEQNNRKILYIERKLSRIAKHLTSLDKRKEKLKNRIKAAILFSSQSDTKKENEEVHPEEQPEATLKSEESDDEDEDDE